MQVMRPIRILVVEDDEDFRHLIIQTLELEEDLTIVGLCRTREDAVCTALQTQPDIALMDLSLSRNGRSRGGKGDPQADGCEGPDPERL